MPFSPDWPRPGSTSRRRRRRPQPNCLPNRSRPDHADPAFRLSMWSVNGPEPRRPEQLSEETMTLRCERHQGSSAI
jgi:hypothetical protein